MVSFKRFGRKWPCPNRRALPMCAWRKRVKPRKRQNKRFAGQVSNGALLIVSRYANPLVLFPRAGLKFQSIFLL